MSAFALDYSGDPVRCDFKGCILNAWHDGEHAFAAKEIQWTYDRHCVVCGVPFTVIGADKAYPSDTCGSQECLLHFARRWTFTVSLMCRCPQRDYPHDLAIHSQLRQESYNPKLKMCWPWSLCLSMREEPSTERKAA
jgi:predicted nucleic acid-binding Zn ribbon protein